MSKPIPWRRVWLALAGGLLGLTLVIWVAFGVGSSEAVEACEKQSRPVGVHIVSGHCIWKYLETNDKQWMVIATFGLLAVTAALAWFTYRLWRETGVLARDTSEAAGVQASKMEASVQQAARAANAIESQVSQMRATEQRELRAYLGVRVMRYYPDEPGVPFVIKITNFGRTPAFGVVALLDRFVLPYPLPESDEGRLRPRSDIDPHPNAPVTLNPGAFTYSFSSGRRRDIGGWDLVSIRDGKTQEGQGVQLYCLGTVWYRDIFGKQHWVNFCATFGGEFSEKHKRGAIFHLHNNSSDDPEGRPAGPA